MPVNVTKKADAPANAAQKHGGKWKPGQSGNPAGKKPGTKHRASMLAEQLIEGQAEALVQKAISMALAGDAQIMKALLDRLCPAPKGRAINLPLPQPDSPESITAGYSAIIAAVGSGSISPEDGTTLARLLADTARATALQALADDIRALKRHVGLEA